MKKNNKLNRIKDILMEELEIIRDRNLQGENLEMELRRSQAMTQNAQAILNDVKINLRIIDTAQKTGVETKELMDELNIINE